MIAASELTRIYAVGDVHGQLDMLKAIHDRIDEDLERSPPEGPIGILHIGDYVDRGPDSRGVIDYLLDGLVGPSPWICLLGNHDRMMRAFLERPGGRDLRANPSIYWLHPRIGGVETLRSYGLTVPDEVSEEDGVDLYHAFHAAVPPTHRAFLANIPSKFRWGDWFFAHAGIAPGAPLAAQVEDDLIWIRAEFLQSRLDYGVTVVHGHTPVETVEDHGNRIAIDTGAAYGGALSCVVFEGAGARILGGRVLRAPK